MERNRPKVTKDPLVGEWTDRGVPERAARRLARLSRRAEKLGPEGRVRAMRRIARQGAAVGAGA